MLFFTEDQKEEYVNIPGLSSITVKAIVDTVAKMISDSSTPQVGLREDQVRVIVQDSVKDVLSTYCTKADLDVSVNILENKIKKLQETVNGLNKGA